MKRPIWKSRPVLFLLEMTRLYFDKRVSRSAAELAYFLLLSVFPALICVNALVGKLNLNITEVLELADTILPAGVQSILNEYLGYIGVDQSNLLTAGVIMTLFSASAAFRALMNIMDDLYERKSYTGLWQVVASVVYSVLFLVTIYLSGVVVLTGNWFFRLLEDLLPIQLPETNWPWMRFLILFCMVLFFILLIYRVSAPRGEPRPPVFTGAILASVMLVAASMIFSNFIDMSTRYSLVYGSLASVIILMIWLYLCGNILILGNLFNCVWYGHQKRKQEKGRKNPPKSI